MSATLSKGTIEAAKSAILPVIEQYVAIRKRGASYQGCCPFHQERTPSFHVHPKKEFYKCFGCGAKGDAIQFVMEQEKKTFTEAVELIAAIAGFPVETEDGISHTNRIVSKPRKVLCQPTNFDTIPLMLLSEDNHDTFANPLTAQIGAIVGNDVVREVVTEYKISIDGNWITFNQVDFSGQYRTGKSICRKSDGGRTNRFKWVHDDLKRKALLPGNYSLKQCFTGEHLLKVYPAKPVAIVEGQSTMLFMAALGRAALKYNIKELKYFSSFLWLATGGADGIGWKEEQVFRVLNGRYTILFPDAGFYGQWLDDAAVMQEHGMNVQVSQFLETKYKDGLLHHNDDLRDYFLQYTDAIKEICLQSAIEIEIKNLLPASIVTKTSEEFGNLISASFWLKDGRFIDVLYDKNGELILFHPSIESLEKYFNKQFIPGKIDGNNCLIHIQSNKN